MEQADTHEDSALPLLVPQHPYEENSALRATLVGAAMAQLSTEHRAVVRRSYYQGWTTAQIAADLGIAEASAKSRLHYALRDLQQRLQETRVTP